MAAVDGSSEAAVRFARALGLDPKKVQRIDLHINTNAIVTVTTTMLVSEKELNDLGLEVKRFKLVEDE